MTQDTLLQQVQSLVAAARVDDAYELLMRQAEKSAYAAYILAEWRLSGDVIRRDLPEARRLFGLAAQMGMTAARDAHVAMLANGAGGSGRDWTAAVALLKNFQDPAAKRQSELLGAMTIDDQGNPLAIAPLIEAVPGLIWTLPQFLSAEEAEYLIGFGIPRLQPSFIVHPANGRMLPDPIRKSSFAAIPFVLENPFIHALNRRIAQATQTTYEHGEPLQILRYRPSEEYKLHMDVLPATTNQRRFTLLAYLNEDFDGGETTFPSLGFTKSPRLGDALLFRNTDDAGRPIKAMRHAGLPVTRGEKFLATKWIRTAPLDLSGPSGRPF